MDERYLKSNIDKMIGWSSKAEQRKELRRLKQLVKRRLERLERSDYWGLAQLRLSEADFADVIARPERYTLEQQLAGFARVAGTNISVTGLRAQVKAEQEYASQIGIYYENKYGDLGFSEFMGAVRYSGLMDRYGSEQAVKMFETVEERRLNPVRVLENYERYKRKYNIQY